MGRNFFGSSLWANPVGRKVDIPKINLLQFVGFAYFTCVCVC